MLVMMMIGTGCADDHAAAEAAVAAAADDDDAGDDFCQLAHAPSNHSDFRYSSQQI